MNLVRAELGRLAARRFVQLMLVLLVAAFGVTIATTLASSHIPTSQELASAEQSAERQRQANERMNQLCVQVQPGNMDTGSLRGQVPPECGEFIPQHVNAADYLDGVFVFEREIRDLVYFLIAFLALFGFLVGASAIGAELASGGMTNLLLWWPRRMRVLGTKLGTLLAGTLAVSVLSGLLYLGAFRLIAEVGGQPGQLDGAFWPDLVGVLVRGLGLVLMVTALGFALAALGRHTSAALGVVAAYLVVWELGVRLVMDVSEMAGSERIMLSTYLGAWISGEYSIWPGNVCHYGSTGGCGVDLITWPTALVVLLVVVGGLLAAAFATFRRRDLA